MTTKGQITIPAEVRRQLGLHAGSRVTFIPTDDGGYELRVERRSIQELHGILRPYTDGRPRTLEEMDEAIAAGAAHEPE